MFYFYLFLFVVNSCKIWSKIYIVIILSYISSYSDIFYMDVHWCFVFSLEMYRKVHNLRILACGGDGTVSECVCVSVCGNNLHTPCVDVWWMVYIGLWAPPAGCGTAVLSSRLWAEEEMILLSHNTVTLFRWVMCLRSFLTCNADVCVLFYPMLSHLHNPFVWVIKSVKEGSERSYISYTDFDPWERSLGILP